MIVRYVVELLDNDEQEDKDRLIAEGFEAWSGPDFQQFIQVLKTYRWFVCSIFSFVVTVDSEMSV